MSENYFNNSKFKDRNSILLLCFCSENKYTTFSEIFLLKFHIIKLVAVY